MKQEELFKATAIPLPPPPNSSGASGRNNPCYSVEDAHIAVISSQCTIMSAPGIMKTTDEAELLKYVEYNEKSQKDDVGQTSFQLTIPDPPPKGDETMEKDNPPPYPVADVPDSNTNQSTIISLPEIIVNPDMASSVKNMEFSDQSLRHGFIKKVYSILLTQLLLTGCIILGFMQIPSSGVQFILENFWQIYAMPMIIYITTFFCILCCEGPRRRVPWNYVFLLLFTISLSIMVGLVTTVCNAEEVLIAAGITFAIVLSLTLFAFQTKIDFTLLTGSCLCLTLAFVMLGIAMLATSYDRMRLVYLTISVVIISIYIVWDTQMIIGGQHRYGFSCEEYVFAALVLYVDVMYLFMKILRFSR